MNITRRNFLGSSAAVFAAAALQNHRAYSANEKLGVCVMGLHGRGGSHLQAYAKSEHSDLLAICDADENILNNVGDQLDSKLPHKVKRYVDVKDVLADASIDILSIATPNHWHTLASIWAMEAGKDVYVEKPATHDFWEGKQIIAAAKKYGKIVQHGTQSRSSNQWQRDIPLIRSGEIIGKIHTARCLGFKTGDNRDSIGFADDQEAPKHLHWRLWQGPAPEKPYNPNYHPYQWHWFWHYGNGEIGNQGVHQMDIGCWGMDKGLPSKIYSAGGRYTYEDQGETPNTNTALLTYADGTMLVFDVRNRYTNNEDGVGVGNLFYGDTGYYVQGKGFFDKKNQPIVLPEGKHPLPPDQDCFENFLAAVKSRNEAEIHGNMEQAHLACSHMHLANISYRLGRSLDFDTATEKFVNAPDADAMLRREYAPGFEVPELA